MFHPKWSLWTHTQTSVRLDKKTQVIFVTFVDPRLLNVDANSSAAAAPPLNSSAACEASDPIRSTLLLPLSRTTLCSLPCQT